MRHAVGVLVMLSACGGGSGEPASVSPAVSSTNEDSPLGINLTPGGLASQTPEICFKDLFKQAGPWLSSNGLPFAAAASDGTPIPYAGQTAYTQMCRALYGHYPGGTYTCLYDGSGTIVFGYDAAVISQSAGQILVSVTPSDTADGITLRITSSGLADPIRNIRFVPQAYLSDYATQPFTPTFLARWARFKTIRFMNWESLNTSTIENWADRPTTEGPQTGSNGVAIEYMILLANAIHADPWFCMPPRATDDFVARFATLVHASLAPELRVYLEYGNEAWNPVYTAEPYAEQQGLALGLSGDPYTAGRRFVVQRSVEMFGIWEQVFGGTSRLVRTLSEYNNFPQYDLADLDWQNAYGHLDALAVAPYFSLNSDPHDSSAISRMTVRQILDSCLANIDVIMGFVAQHRANATARGLDLVAYEGGQSLVSNDATVIALYVAANRDPGMRSVYDACMGRWRAAGGHMFCHFTSMEQYGTAFGEYGLLEWDDQTSAPKYDALLDFIQTNPRWW